MSRHRRTAIQQRQGTGTAPIDKATYDACLDLADYRPPKPESTEGMMLQQRNGLSRASTKHATGVSLFRINVRLSGQRKCHSVMPTWYQMMTSRDPPGIAALEDPRCPGISLQWLCGFPIPAQLLASTSPCPWLSFRYIRHSLSPTLIAKTI